jgi:hypothetical protein
MLRHAVLLLVAICALSIPRTTAAQSYGYGRPTALPPGAPNVFGPSQILYMDADTVFFMRSQQWWSENVNHQEKLLLRALRLKYWSNHLPPDMRLVFDSLGYPMNRLMMKPVGHSEEWWYYGMLDPPLRFRDGILLDPERFEAYLARR